MYAISPRPRRTDERQSRGTGRPLILTAALVALIGLGGTVAVQARAQDAAGDATAVSRLADVPELAGAGLPEPAADAAPPVDKTSDAVLRVTSAQDIAIVFEALGYSYQAVGDDGLNVPRVFIADVPDDMDALASVNQRKAVFFGMLLPVMLSVNEQIAADRARLIAIAERRDAGEVLPQDDLAFVAALAEDYRVDLPSERQMGEVLAELTLRVDAVPPSMALAQGAVESGWGRSSLAHTGNALFGMITSRGSGIAANDGRHYAAYESLLEAVRAYAHNLNRHAAYDEFRQLRADQRAAGEPLDGYHLLAGLDAYSELGDEYIAYIRRVIRGNDLQMLDEAQLAPGPAPVPSI